MARLRAVDVARHRPHRARELRARRDRLDRRRQHDVLVPHHPQHVVHGAGVALREALGQRGHRRSSMVRSERCAGVRPREQAASQHATRQRKKSSCADRSGAAGGRNRDVSSGTSRSVLRPSRLQAIAKRLRIRSANSPWPPMRTPNRDSLSRAAADLPDDAHHVRRAQRVVRRRASRGTAARPRAAAAASSTPACRAPARGRGLEDRLELVVGELRDHRRDVDADRDAGVAQRLDDREAAMRRRRARVELARELAVEHRDRDEHAHEVLRRHRREQVEVALDQRALGRDRQRMVALGEHLDHRARDLPLALDRLVRDRCWCRARSGRRR